MESSTPQPPFPFPNLQVGMDFLARLPLAQPAAAETQLASFLDALIAAPPRPSELLLLLEQARPAVLFVAGELSARYRDRPLALSDAEEVAFKRVTALWEKMWRAYRLCWPALAAETEPGEQAQAAVVCQRAVACGGMMIVEHFRARREVPEALWLELHSCYRKAEAAGVSEQPVADPLHTGKYPPQAGGCYAALLLMELAGPYRQNARDIEVIWRWLAMWGGLARIRRIEPGCIPSHFLELDKPLPLRPGATDIRFGADAREVDLRPLLASLREIHSSLKQRVAPAELGLGDETVGRATALVEQLLSSFTQGEAHRRFRRFSASGTARVGVGFEAMYHLVAGREFAQPDAARAYSRAHFDALFSFRDLAEPVQKPGIRANADFPVDEWEVFNHSANGFQLVRTLAGQKMQFGQLLALCPHDGNRFLLAQVRWLSQELAGGLRAGVAVLPGMPAGVAARAATPRGSTAVREPYVRAFLLPAVAAINAGPSLVLPLGLYQASRDLEICDEAGCRQVRMKSILQRGADFDRIGFEEL